MKNSLDNHKPGPIAPLLIAGIGIAAAIFGWLTNKGVLVGLLPIFIGVAIYTEVRRHTQNIFVSALTVFLLLLAYTLVLFIALKVGLQHSKPII